MGESVTRCWLVGLSLAAGVAGAAEYALTGGDAPGTNSFMTAGKWNSGAAPEAGHTYRTAAYQLRTPENTTGTAYTFAGDALTVNTSGSILWKCSGPVTVGNLILAGGSIAHGLDNYTGRLYGNLSVTACRGEIKSRHFVVGISGRLARARVDGA